jgi:D-alanine-D-alanine ligase
VVERHITSLLEPDQRFLTYERYWGEYKEETPIPGGEPLYRYESVPGALGVRLAAVCRDAYLAVDGSGYGRVDLRTDAAGTIFVLEVNANCGVSDDGDTSVSHILRLAGRRAADLVGEFLADARARHARGRGNGGAPGDAGRAG